MRALASFIMSGRPQAVLVMIVANLLPLLNIVSTGTVALVTLRRGVQEGLLCLLPATVVLGALVWLEAGTPKPMLGVLAVSWLPVWLLAGLLRYTISLGLTLQFALLLAVLAVSGGTLYLGDPTAWGEQMLQQLAEPLQQMDLSPAQTGAVEQALAMLAPRLLGLGVATGLLSTLIGLMLGRWWQSLLYRPGGFREEFHQLRLGRTAAAVTAGVLLIAVLLRGPFWVNLVPALWVIYTLQGLAVVHGVAGRLNRHWGWLAAVYVLLLLALPEVALLLAALGIVDAWVNVRARIKPVMSKS